MTVTSNNPSQINAALMDLQRHMYNTGKSNIRIDTSSKLSEQEIRFYMSDFTSDATSHSYILLGDVIVLFGRNKFANWSWVHVYTTAQSAKYYQAQQTVEIPVPYKLKSGSLIHSGVKSFSNNSEGVVIRANQLYAGLTGSSKALVSMPNGNHITFATPFTWNNLPSSINLITDYIIVGEIDI